MNDHNGDPVWQIPQQRDRLPVLRLWGPDGETWEADEALGCYVMRLYGVEVRCHIDPASEYFPTTERFDILDGGALPIACPGSLYGWMFEQAVKETKSVADLALFLLTRVLGSERLAEIAGTSQH